MNVVNYFLLLLMLVSALATFPGESEAATWDVLFDGSGDAPTIQAGIDSAAVGDTVLVHPGTYNENIDFLGKDIAVVGAGASQTVIDGSSQIDACVKFMNGEGSGAVLEGFTVTGGRGHDYTGSGLPWGGGIFIRGSGPLIKNNIIENNVADSGGLDKGVGGGVYCSGPGEPIASVFESNAIKNNHSATNGGGIACSGNVPAIIIRGNEITGNTTGEGDGAGIWLFIEADGCVVSDNVIAENDAGDHGGGIMVSQRNAFYPPLQVSITGNIIAGNVARFVSSFFPSGGGVLLATVQGEFSQNTIVLNDGQQGGGVSGGGVAILSGSDLVVEKNIIAYTVGGGGLRCEQELPVIRNNLAWDNTGGDGVFDCPDWTETDGNVVADPLFCDLGSGSYALAENSPALSHPAGPLGAIPLPGCGPVSVQPITWGLLKSRYLPGN